MLQAIGRKQPRWIYGLLAVVAVLLLLLIFVAPSNDWQRSGSTYNRGPDGYGAWYEYMEKQGVTLTRSRQSIPALLAAQSRSEIPKPQTLLQVQPRLISTVRLTRGRRTNPSSQMNSAEYEWLAAGNNLIVLGVRQPVRNPQFSSRLSSEFGSIQVDTGRRAAVKPGEALLDDAAGAVVWEMLPQSDNDDAPDAAQTIADAKSSQFGRLILATTPHLGANAYQSVPGNYEFLADLVNQPKSPILVDEFIHGYRQPQPQGAARPRRSPAAQNQSNGLLNYFARTPLLPVAVQVVILLLIAIGAKNRRFGRLKSVEPPIVDNSLAYIRALAGALRQANSRSFVVETVSQAELRQIQRQLGLGNQPMELSEIVAALSAQQQPTAALKAVLRMQSRQSISDRELLQWLQELQRLRKQVQS